MWRRKTETGDQGSAAAPSKAVRFGQMAIATGVFIAALIGITYLDDILASLSGRPKNSDVFKLQNASALSLILILSVTVLYAYVLLVTLRPRQIVFVCFSCDEAFKAQSVCPNCGSTDVADIRSAEWHEN